MSKRKINNISILSILFLYILFYRFFLLREYLKYAEYISAAFIIVLLFISIFLLGFKKNRKSKINKDITTLVVSVIILFFALTYALGLFMGFLRNAYSLKVSSIFVNMFCPVILLIGLELFRYVIIDTNRHSKSIIIVSVILITLFDLVINIRIIDFANMIEVFKIFTSQVIPIVVKSLVLSHFAYHVGYKIPIIYRIFIDLYVYVMPIIPDLGEYLQFLINVCLPFCLYLISNKMITRHKEGIQYNFSKASFTAVDGVIIFFIVALAFLASGNFNYYMLAIASESMSGTINKGDAVIIKKIDSGYNLKVGEIVNYKNNNMTIVHRLVDIVDDGDKTYYLTKGDINSSYDNVDLEREDISGVVKLKIPYIAYPTVYLSKKRS